MAQAADLPGAAHLELVDGVVHLDPKPALLEAMLTGWARQQRARFLKDDTIKQRLAGSSATSQLPALALPKVLLRSLQPAGPWG